MIGLSFIFRRCHTALGFLATEFSERQKFFEAYYATGAHTEQLLVGLSAFAQTPTPATAPAHAPNGSATAPRPVVEAEPKPYDSRTQGLQNGQWDAKPVEIAFRSPLGD